MSRVAWFLITVFAFIGCAPQDASENVKQKRPGGAASGAKAEDPKVPTNSAERKTVVTLTPAAVEMVKSILKQDPHPYLRVKVQQGGPTGYLYDLRFDERMDPAQDYVDDFHGVTIVVERSSAPFLVGTSIDFED